MVRKLTVPRKKFLTHVMSLEPITQIVIVWCDPRRKNWQDIIRKTNPEFDFEPLKQEESYVLGLYRTDEVAEWMQVSKEKGELLISAFGLVNAGHLVMDQKQDGAVIYDNRVTGADNPAEKPGDMEL